MRRFEGALETSIPSKTAELWKGKDFLALPANKGSLTSRIDTPGCNEDKKWLCTHDDLGQCQSVRCALMMTWGRIVKPRVAKFFACAATKDEGFEVWPQYHTQVEKNTTITITGADKAKIGDFASTVRRQREPEPYKGKGIRYEGEVIKLKEGKAGGKKK
eukprot:1159173-Pelagomonas_calceolata.AAC.1